jgi:hypothetical protein
LFYRREGPFASVLGITFTRTFIPASAEGSAASHKSAAKPGTEYFIPAGSPAQAEWSWCGCRRNGGNRLPPLALRSASAAVRYCTSRPAGRRPAASSVTIDRGAA